MEIPKQLQNEEFRFVPIKRGTKAPIGLNWQTTNNYKYNSLRLRYKQNYGVVCGFGNLYVIDFDDEEFQDIFLRHFPQTFSVKTGGSGLLHLYFRSWILPKSFKVLSKNGRTLADIQGVGKQVVGAGSFHIDTGKPYVVWKDIPITNFDISETERIFQEFKIQEFGGGANNKGNTCNGLRFCPFQERHKKGKSGIERRDIHPSLAIYEETKTFYCFGCGCFGLLETLKKIEETQDGIKGKRNK